MRGEFDNALRHGAVRIGERVQAQLAVDDVVVVVELLQGDADWCVVSYIGAG